MDSPAPHLSVPIQAALSINISTQTALLPQLFSAISNGASGAGPSSTKQSVTQVFAELARLDNELAVLMERARKHQQRWSRMEELKRETINVESKVRDTLLVLEDGRRDLEMVLRDAKNVVSSIELAEKNPSDPKTLLSFASSLAHYTSAPPSMDTSRRPPSAFYPPFPAEHLLRSGKLNMGGALLGTVGETKDIGSSDDPTTHNGISRITLFDAPPAAGGHNPLAPARPRVTEETFNLDLNSDSDDD